MGETEQLRPQQRVHRQTGDPGETHLRVRGGTLGPFVDSTLRLTCRTWSAAFPLRTAAVFSGGTARPSWFACRLGVEVFCSDSGWKLGGVTCSVRRLRPSSSR